MVRRFGQQYSLAIGTHVCYFIPDMEHAAFTVSWKKIFFEAAVLAAAGMVIGVCLNYTMVKEGFDGRLTAFIKQYLQDEVAGKAASSSSGAEHPSVILIDLERARQWYEEGTNCFIDARPDDEYRAGHIPGALNVLPGDLEDIVPELSARVQTDRIIVYCVGPECPEAIELAELMNEFGISPVHVYLGGWEQWSGQGLPGREGDRP